MSTETGTTFRTEHQMRNGAWIRTGVPFPSEQSARDWMAENYKVPGRRTRVIRLDVRVDMTETVLPDAPEPPSKVCPRCHKPQCAPFHTCIADSCLVCGGTGKVWCDANNGTGYTIGCPACGKEAR